MTAWKKFNLIRVNHAVESRKSHVVPTSAYRSGVALCHRIIIPLFRYRSIQSESYCMIFLYKKISERLSTSHEYGRSISFAYV